MMILPLVILLTKSGPQAGVDQGGGDKAAPTGPTGRYRTPKLSDRFLATRPGVHPAFARMQ